ncbi:MAG: M42 family metallopeptidase [Anaerolineae bacterium]|nr:MAG: M42 family metallopeptidase [Anaerolineae bacterium]
MLVLLKALIQLPGLSGYEGPVQRRMRAEWEPLSDEVRVGRIGSLYATMRGSGQEPRKSVMLAAHMDAIGLMASELVDGFIRAAPIGGLDARVLPGQPVIVHGRRDLPGIVVQPPMHILPEDLRRKPIPLKYLLVDVGLPNPARVVRPGDLISFAQPPTELGEDVLSGHSLDNRASLVAITECLRELGRREHGWDVLAVATVQEEETFAGAYAAGFELKPSVAVAVDVTWARGPELPEHKTFPLGKGPTNGWGPNMHPGIYSALEAAAKRVEIPLTREVLPANCGTDAFALQIAGEGLPTGLISIPLKYMHTPVEVVSLKDVRRTGRLLAEFVAGLDADFMDTLSWD